MYQQNITTLLMFSVTHSLRNSPSTDHMTSRSILRKELLPRLGQFTPSQSPELKALHEFIDDNLCSGFIMPSHSPPWSSSAFLSRKDQRTLSLCRFPWPETRYPRKTIIPFHSFLISSTPCAPLASIPNLISDMLIILYA